MSNGDRSEEASSRLAKVAFRIRVASLLLWPWSYAWIPQRGHNPAWISILVPAAEWGAVACAIAAIVLGRRASRAGASTLAARWAPRLGVATLAAMALALAVAIAVGPT